ncbi:MAG: glycosyltransferase WbuB, partial [Nitrosomonadales bacterium]|nr:glycosyltransferase WbuB [Nitrosomonadales bacterium]
MHILLVHQYFLQKNGTGGSRFNEMVNFWSQEGHQVTVLAGMIYHNSGYKYDEYKGKYFVDEKYAELVRVIRCHDSESGQSSFLSRLKVYLVFVFYSLYAGVFKAKDKYDVIVVTSPP